MDYLHIFGGYSLMVGFILQNLVLYKVLQGNEEKSI